MIDSHIVSLLKESAELNSQPPRKNPYYSRSFSHSGKISRSNSMDEKETPRRNSDNVTSRHVSVSEVDATTTPTHTPPRVFDLVNQSPFGPLENSGSRKTFVYLIAVLNSTYPDHDFSSLEPADFNKITPAELIEKFNNIMLSLGKMPMEWIWDTLSVHIDIHKCSVYCYVPSESFLEDEPGSLWSQMWFLFNKKKKRVAYLYLNAIKRSVPISKSYYIGQRGKRRPSITIDDEEDEDSYDESEFGSDIYESALMSDIDEE